MIRKIIFFIVLVLLVSSASAQDIIKEFKALNGEDWDVRVASWGYIIFVGKERPEMIGSPLSEEEAIGVAEQFLSKNSHFFGIETLKFSRLEMSGAGETPYLLWIIDFEGQFYEGIPVKDTYTRVLMTIDGQIYGVGNKRYSLEDVSTDPSIPSNQANDIAKEFINTTKDPVETKLNIVVEENETDVEYGLVWEVHFGEPDNKEVLIDAEDGNVLSVGEWSGERIPKLSRSFLYVIGGIILVLIFLVLFKPNVFVRLKSVVYRVTGKTRIGLEFSK